MMPKEVFVAPDQPAFKSWRDVLKVHPAADLFPLMSADELKVLGEDIQKNGLQHPVVLWSPGDDDKTVASVRRELEGRSEIPNVATRPDTKGRNQPAKRQAKPARPAGITTEPPNMVKPPPADDTPELRSMRELFERGRERLSP